MQNKLYPRNVILTENVSQTFFKTFITSTVILLKCVVLHLHLAGSTRLVSALSASRHRHLLELETKVADDYAKFYNHGEGPYWLKAPTRAFTFKTLLRHYHY